MDDNTRTAELRRKLDKDPGSRLFAQLAEELRKDGRHDEAISVARKGLEKNPNYPSARLTLARALLDSGKPREARPELEQIVKASPDNILASRLLGDALEDVGEMDAAIQQFEKTLRLSPGDKALTEKIAEIKARLAPPPTLDLRPKSPPPAVLPAFDAPPPVAVPVADAALPSAFDEPPSAPVAPSPAPSVALDRDLASGTFSPGSLSVSDLNFDGPPPPSSPVLPAVPEPEIERTVAFGEMDRFSAPLDTAETVSLSSSQVIEPVVELPAPPPQELPSVDLPEDPDIGAQTLPLTSLTLADLYLQQGLKAEASAVLSQVIREEPENAVAKSKFAAVSEDLASVQVEPAEHFPETDVHSVKADNLKDEFKAEAISAPEPVPPPVIELPAVPPVQAVAAPGADSRPSPPTPRSKAEIRDRSIASLKALLSAIEREAVEQRATERGAF